MKLFSLILSFYILTLNVLPSFGFNSDGSDEEVCAISCCDVGQSDQPSDSEDGCPDLCNPFMSCSTCVGFIFQSFTIEFEAFDLTNRTVTDYYESFAKRYRTSIWHPPKLA